jgi:hypothetical protein
MMIGNRKCHGDLTIVLLAKFAAILPCNPDRMPPLLGKARVIDDPSFDRPVALQLRQYQLADLGQNLLVRPVAFTNKMQQRLMLGRSPFRRRNRRHRLDTLALARHHEPHAIIAKRSGPVRVPDHARQALDIR